MLYSENDIPDLTGGNSDIGKQTIAVLASKGAKVYLAGRSEAKYRQALDEIHTSHPDSAETQIEYLNLDLSTAKGAKEAAENFKSRESVLHVLYNNAGVMGTPKGQTSKDGDEFQWAVNVLGPFVSSPRPSSSHCRVFRTRTVRIVNTASDGAKQAPKTGIPLDDPTVGTRATPFQRYGHSKLGNILISRQLATRYPKIWSFAPHPGPVQSELIRDSGIPRPIKWLLNRILFKPVQYGALTQLFVGTSPSIDASKNGAYLVPLAKFEDKLPHVQASDN